MANWTFKVLPVGLTFRQPTAGEFFATDAMSNPGEALVRESIQNSLDATDVEGGGTAGVRIALLEGTRIPSNETVQKLFQEAWPHIKAQGNGLTPDLLPEFSEPCKAIIVEDFGARGLEGEPSVAYPPDEGIQNHFFYFFRAEALTDKDTETKRGSWGLGKDTFLRASRINTFLGLTIRKSDGCRLLMGKTVLKSHKVHGDFYQDGFFGNLDEKSHLVMPVADDGLLDEIASQFQLSRDGQTGLSVIVPWPHDEIGGFEILEAVLRNYAYCILKGQLRVRVEADKVDTVIGAETLIQVARDYSKEIDALPREALLRPIELAEWALNGIRDYDRYILKMPPIKEAWKWKRSLFPAGVIEELREKIQSRQNVAIRVPVTVRPKVGVHKESFFDVYISFDESERTPKPICIRDGILISDSRAVTPRKGIRSLIVVEDQPLAELLRRAENPSHTLWQDKNLKSEYIYGPSCLNFVRRSVKEICAQAMAEDKSKDRRLLTDFFPILKSGTENAANKVVVVPASPQLSVNRLAGGFYIGPGAMSLEADSLVEVSFAYDSRGRDPLKAYSPFDFRLSDAPLESYLSGAESLERADNRLLFRIVNPNGFRVEITGFDQNRQVFVKVQVWSANA